MKLVFLHCTSPPSYHLGQIPMNSICYWQPCILVVKEQKHHGLGWMQEEALGVLDRLPTAPRVRQTAFPQPLEPLKGDHFQRRWLEVTSGVEYCPSKPDSLLSSPDWCKTFGTLRMLSISAGSGRKWRHLLVGQKRKKKKRRKKLFFLKYYYNSDSNNHKTTKKPSLLL